MKILSVLVTLLVLKECCCTSSVLSNRDIVNENLRKAVQFLNSTIDYLHELSVSYAENSTLVEEQKLEKIEEIGNAIFEGIVVVLNGALNYFEKIWSEEGRIIIDCIHKEETNTRTAFQSSFVNYGACMITHVPKVIYSYQSLLGETIKTRNILSIAQRNLENCRLGDLCLILRTIGDLKGIETNISKMINATPPILEVLGEILFINRPICLKSDAKTFEKRMYEVFFNIVNCALN